MVHSHTNSTPNTQGKTHAKTAEEQPPPARWSSFGGGYFLPTQAANRPWGVGIFDPWVFSTHPKPGRSVALDLWYFYHTSATRQPPAAGFWTFSAISGHFVR